MEANPGEAHAELVVEAHMAQLDGCGDGADRQPGGEAFVDLARLQAPVQVTFEAQFAAGGGDIEHRPLDRLRQLVAVQFDGHQLGLFERRAVSVAPLVVGHLVG
ncbi:hypothetical protein D9M73_278460 [compost metagenome]